MVRGWTRILCKIISCVKSYSPQFVRQYVVLMLENHVCSHLKSAMSHIMDALQKVQTMMTRRDAPLQWMIRGTMKGVIGVTVGMDARFKIQKEV